ncbi:hypothetical protein [Xenorhabdus bovienii]|uniref:hypothetical protein n=1 Tax=Xenorhabdus bovienii TaxID=40576 RepID=UPI003DA21578
MSKLKINRLVIRTNTANGVFGADLGFTSGLNIISAENSFGKSTCIQSIIYALGLEGTLGPSRNNPLKSALTTKLRDENDKETTVILTKIYLEICNSVGKTITILRKSDDDASKIVSVFDGACETINVKKHTDYFLKDPGSAQRERGFHYFLNNFLNIIQPEVIKYDGTKTQLYLESMFCVNYVEQTRGWGGILNVTPTYLGIKDLSQNIIEYTLDLDIRDIRRKREVHLETKKNLEIKWQNTLSDLESRSKTYSFFVSARIPEKLGIKTQVYSDSDLYTLDSNENEVSLSKKISFLQLQLSSLTGKYKNDNSDINEEIEQLNKSLISHENIAANLIADLDINQQYIESITKSINDTKESLRKYRDVEKLQELGSREKFRFIENICPTCDQPINHCLLPSTVDNQTLSIDNNIKYLEKTQSVFDSLLKSERVKIQRKEKTVNISNNKLRELRYEIKSLQRSLLSPMDSNVREIIRKEVELEKEIDNLLALSDLEKAKKTVLSSIVVDWQFADSLLHKLPYDGFSPRDRTKLSLLKNSFKSNLSDFGYKSTPIDLFELSTNTYKPSLDGVDIGSEASASDNIRVIWSYLYSLLMLDTYDEKISTNHLGLLILDEPRQQETKDVSFQTFIKKASETFNKGKQIIIGTSEKYEELTRMLENLKVNLMHFDESIIRRIK